MFYSSSGENNYKLNVQRILYNIKKTDKKIFKGCCIYVIRRRRGDGSLANSKPCLWCAKLIKAFKFRKVIYSSGTGTWIKENPNKLKTTHVSVGVIAREEGKYLN